MSVVQNRHSISRASCSRLDELLTVAALECPNHVALVTFERSWTYAQLRQQVDNLVQAIKTHHLPKQARIACLLDNGSAFVLLACAASQLDLVFVPINSQYALSHVCDILQQTQAQLLFTTPERALHLQESQTTLVCDASLMDSFGIVSVQLHQEVLSDVPVQDDLAVLFFTSGSTGRPKGIMATHANLMHGAMSMDIVFSPISNP